MTDTAEATSDVRTCNKCESPFGADDDKRFKWCAICRGAVEAEEPVLDVAEDDSAWERVGGEPGVEPIKLEIEQAAPPPSPPREFYWCGATKDSPIHNITLGGIAFPKFIGEIREGEVAGKQQFRDNAADGQIHSLTKAHVGLILEHAKNKVIRNWRREVLGNDPSGEQPVVYMGDILSMTGQKHRPYVFREGDKPIGNFVYMVRVRSRKDRPMENPPTLVERNW